MQNRNSGQLEFPEVIVVEASAGAGKTYELSKRYLQLLINPHFKSTPISLRNILAITFTNKATIEMKKRILDFLKKIALDGFENETIEEDILCSLGLKKNLCQIKSSRIMDELIRHYNFFQVQTIDSFINSLLLGSSLNIDRSGSFTIKRDYTRYLVWCLDSVIDEAVENRAIFTFLEKFLKHYLFIENRNSWFPKKDILKLIHTLFSLSNKYGSIFKPTDKTVNDFLGGKSAVFKAICTLAKELPAGMNGKVKNSILKFVREGNKNFRLERLPGSFQSNEVLMNKGAVISEQFNRHWRRIRNYIVRVAELEAEVTYTPYMKLFERIFAYFQIISKKEDVLFLEELNHKARYLFHNGLSVAEVYYRLATRLEHYLIDEFQDTSYLQWDNLRIMVEDALSSGGTLFYVGDKKQAIYRFRGGEAQLFDELKNELMIFNVKGKYLRKNWRSQKAIVDFNNEIFAQNNLKKALINMDILSGEKDKLSAYKEILEVYQDSHEDYCKDKTAGYVKVVRINNKNKFELNTIMKTNIINLVRELSKRFAFSDIAFLCRDNSEVELVTTWLLAAQFPVQSEKRSEEHTSELQSH